jgi:uncharacterized protein YecT (DUF1311 family)
MRLSGQEPAGRPGIVFGPGTGACPADRWCVSIQVVDQHSAAPVVNALIAVRQCMSLRADAGGRAVAVCPASAPGDVQVLQIGYRPAVGKLEPRVGQSYAGTVRLRTVGTDVVADPFVLPCEEWEGEEQRRCLTHELERAQARLSILLDSVRAQGADGQLLESAQAAWSRYAVDHCRLQSYNAATAEDSALAVLDCRLWLTVDRARELEVLLQQRSGEPPNRGLERPGAPAGLRNEHLEGPMSRSLTRRIAWMALAPAAQARVR